MCVEKKVRDQTKKKLLCMIDGFGVSTQLRVLSSHCVLKSLPVFVQNICLIVEGVAFSLDHECHTEL